MIEPENMMRQPVEWFRERANLVEVIFLYYLRACIDPAASAVLGI